MYDQIKSKRIKKVVDDIIDEYAYSDNKDRPWIIGFSGGKRFNSFINSCLDCVT